MENKMKPGTNLTIRELNDASIRTIMATGDNILTAIAVGK
jgi:cation-transporting ATPase 13A3/4/5